jgi:23S rRNA (adenine2503-C2)-methyltransferase
MEHRPNLFGLDRDELIATLRPWGLPDYRARQVYAWLYRKRETSIERWTDLPRPLRARLAETFAVDAGRVAATVEARDGTVKFRVALARGGEVETVRMVQDDRLTLCVSSQVGCALACDFCLTGKMGLERQLSAGEIVGQVLLATDPAQPFNVVFMGMGEPLHNYDAVVAAIELLTDAEALGLSSRRITVSTSGLVPAIDRLAGARVRPRLAVSLNATTDTLRDRLMPINRRYDIACLLEACRRFARASGERVTLEYVLLAGVNDGADDVTRLARLARTVPSKVNLIPFNPVPGRLDYRPPSRRAAIAWRDALAARDVPVSIRWSRGAEARAACGQLAILEGEGADA